MMRHARACMFMYVCMCVCVCLLYICIKRFVGLGGLNNQIAIQYSLVPIGNPGTDKCVDCKGVHICTSET